MVLLRPLTAAVLLAVLGACGGSQEADDLPDTVEPYVPPASTVPTTTVSADPCEATIQQLDGVEPLAEDIDLLELAAANELAPLPVPGADEAIIAAQATQTTPEEYVAGVTFDDPAKRVDDLKAAGHVATLNQEYAFGADHYGLFIQELGSEQQAETYLGIHLLEVCRRVDSMRAMSTVHGGASYFYLSEPGPPLATATFVLGRYEVNLDICTCVEESDRQGLAENWAAAIVKAANAA